MDEMRAFRLDEISIRSVFIDIVKNIWVIILAMLAAWFTVTGAQKLLYVPEYTATATLAVNARGNSAYSSLSLTGQMAGVFSEVFSSNVLREKIAEDMGVASVDGDITSAVISETNLITLKVTASDPRKTYMIIRSALKNYDKVSNYLFSNAVLRTVSEPTVPYSPSNNLNLGRLRKLSMLGAGLAAGALIVLLSVFRFTVKTKESAARNLDGKIIGTIPWESKGRTDFRLSKRKKRSLLMSSSLTGMQFAESCRKVSMRLLHHMRKRDQKVILVTSLLENEGKSSVAANLALALAEKNKRVVLVDTDLKKPAQYRIFDRPNTEKSWLSDYLEGKASANDVLYYDHKLRMFSIFQNNRVSNSAELLDSKRMHGLLKSCRQSVDYVILDSAPMALSSDTELLMKQADTVILVVREDWADLRAINDASDLVRQSGADFAGFVLNAFHRSLSLQGGHGYGNYAGHRKNMTWRNENGRT